MSEISTALHPFSSLFESLLMDEIEKSSKLMYLEAGTVMLEPGGHVKFIPLKVNGSIKVFRQGSNNWKAVDY